MVDTSLLKRAYKLGLKAAPNFETLPANVIAYYEQHPEEIPRALVRGFVIETMDLPQPEAAKPSPLPPLFSIVARTSLGTIAGKKTDRYFKGSRWYYRDCNFDVWFSANQSSTPASEIATLAPNRPWIFAQAAAFVLGFPPETPIKALGEGLIALGHTMTLSQVEEMVEKTEAGESTGLKTDSYWNFFFTETGNPNDPVSVGGADRDGNRGWNALVGRLGSGLGWGAVDRLLLCNVGTLKLGA